MVLHSQKAVRWRLCAGSDAKSWRSGGGCEWAGTNESMWDSRGRMNVAAGGRTRGE